MAMDVRSVYSSGSSLNSSNATTSGMDGAMDWMDGWFSDMNLQNRASVVITQSFSLATSAAVVTSVLYDSWQRSKRPPDLQYKRFIYLIRIPPVHILPLTLGIASLIQGAVFLTTQTMGLELAFFHNCRAISQAAWTALWVPAYAIFVFSVETTYRFLAARGLSLNRYIQLSLRWTMIVVLVILTWIPSRTRLKVSNTCPAYLPNWVDTWSDIATVLTGSLILMFILCAGIINLRLRRRTSVLCHDHRQAARELVHYLIVNMTILALTLPFWIQSAFFEPPGERITDMAVLSLCLLGLVNSALYVFLRVSRDNSLLCSGKSHCLNDPDWYAFNSTELAIASQINKPVDPEQNLPGPPVPNKDSYRGSGITYALSSAKYQPPQTMQTPNVPMSTTGKKMPFQHMDRRSSIPSQYRRRTNYSIFPTRFSSRQPREIIRNSSLTTDDAEDILRPPKPSFGRHRRFSSDISAATVQIGLRISNIAMPVPMQKGLNESTHSLGLASPTHLTRLSALSSHPMSSSTSVETPAPLFVGKRETEKTPLWSKEEQAEVNQHQEDTSKLTPPKKQWPLPERLSLLPKKTYKQGPWI